MAPHFHWFVRKDWEQLYNFPVNFSQLCFGGRGRFYCSYSLFLFSSWQSEFKQYLEAAKILKPVQVQDSNSNIPLENFHGSLYDALVIHFSNLPIEKFHSGSLIRPRGLNKVKHQITDTWGGTNLDVQPLLAIFHSLLLAPCGGKEVSSSNFSAFFFFLSTTTANLVKESIKCYMKWKYMNTI